MTKASTASRNVATAARKPVIADAVAKAIAPTAPYVIKGRNALVRNTALAGVASLAYAESLSRAALVSQLKLALGKTPTAPELAGAMNEYVVGRVAHRLADGDCPKAGMSVADRIAFARVVVTQYAGPAKDGVKAKGLRKGQTGRRSIAQHKAVRAAESAWSLIKAELVEGSTTQTLAQKNKRAAAMKGTTARGAKAATPTHSELVKGTSADAPKSAADACERVATMTATLLAFTNKHAALLPAAYGQSIKRFHGAMMELEKERLASEGTEA